MVSNSIQFVAEVSGSKELGKDIKLLAKVKVMPCETDMW